MLVRALLTSRDILLEELQNLSKSINQIIDLSDFTSELDDLKLFGSSLRGVVETPRAVVSAEASTMPQMGSEVLISCCIVLIDACGILIFMWLWLIICIFILEQKPNGSVDFRDHEFFRSLSKDELLNFFHLLGSQILYLWNTFLKFHRFVRVLSYIQCLCTFYSTWMKVGIHFLPFCGF